MKPLTLGFSPCPNDTFIFHALVHGLVESEIHFEEPLLEDVETLNSWAVKGKLDVTKLSFHALGHVLDEYCILHAGSALGRGCGPLLIAAKDVDLSLGKALRIAIPGKYTTAAMLFQMYAPQCSNLVEMRFEQIMASVADGTVDAGVIIHESRFTYAEQGLVNLQDLGEWWENTSGLPIPLGCIAAKRSLGTEAIKRIDKAIKQSLEYAYDNPQKSLPYIRAYAQEMDENVMQEHIKLYVNDFSLDLGDEGMRAVRRFLDYGGQAGILPQTNIELTV